MDVNPNGYHQLGDGEYTEVIFEEVLHRFRTATGTCPRHAGENGLLGRALALTAKSFAFAGQVRNGRVCIRDKMRSLYSSMQEQGGEKINAPMTMSQGV